jgi:aspartate oxidase
LPIRHEKVSYELVVVNLEPSDAISLVNTDLEVDLLPSEKAQQEQEKRAKAEELAAAAVLAASQAAMQRASRAEHIRSSLPQEVGADAKDTVMILVKLPQGN